MILFFSIIEKNLTNSVEKQLLYKVDAKTNTICEKHVLKISNTHKKACVKGYQNKHMLKISKKQKACIETYQK